MTDQSVNLSTLQRWMQAVIQHPGQVATGIEQPPAQAALALDPAALPTVILPSSQQTSAQRLQIYADAYLARLLEVLTHEYPALQHALGAELFAGFALQYLQAHPSMSYTLGQLGARFPEYLAKTRPTRESSVPDWSDFLIDCCRLERLYAEVFDGPGPERSPAHCHALPTDLTAEQFLRQRLQLVEWVQLIALQFPVQEYITAVRHDLAPEIPPPAATWLVVTRRDYRVRRFAISHAEFVVLSAFQRGASVIEALEALSTTAVVTHPTPNDIQSWFQDWTSRGFFRVVSSSDT